ncbi:MAG: flavodoxin family protein [Treponema sp.]|jgi:multimeric flavodoxin WrbA|nr:flavodoxin family protein [Treponema sp.]
MMIRILGICGSPRKAATFYALSRALEAAEEIEGVEAALVELRGKTISPCIGCNACVNAGIDDCRIYHDDMNELYKDFDSYDGVIIASPVYTMGITGQLAAYFSRFRPGYLKQRENPDRMLFFPGAALAVGGTRNGGQEIAINIIHGFFHTKGITVVNGGLGIYGGAAVWSQDRMAQGAQEDLKGMENARAIGRRLALMARLIHAGRDTGGKADRKT